MNAVGYIRVSSEEQSREGCSLAMQREKIRAYCSLNDQNLIQICEDAGLSAKNISGRPGFQNALQTLYSGKASTLVVWKLDRAFRSTQDALKVTEDLNRIGRSLVSICEKLDTTSAVGEFFFTLMASLAQMERKLIGERTAAALQSKKSRNERIGEVPFGMRLAENKINLEPDPHEKKVVALIEDLARRGWSYRRIAQELNSKGCTTKKGGPWSHVQISRICRTAA